MGYVIAVTPFTCIKDDSNARYLNAKIKNAIMKRTKIKDLEVHIQ